MSEKTARAKKEYKPFALDLSLGFGTAVLFSLFIYLEHYGMTLKLLNTLFGLASLTLLLYIPRRALLAAGFFIGIFWFYWIGYSFQYNGVGYLQPFISLLFGFIYMLFFGVLALTNSVALRAILLFGLSFAEPMDFNWLKIELLFVESYIGPYKYQLAIVLAALALPKYLKRPYAFLSLLLLAFALHVKIPPQKDAPLNIKLIATDIKQNEKWERKHLERTIKIAYTEIEDAISEKYDLIVFPESFFPLYMNKNPLLLEKLLSYSYKISIVAGSLLSEDEGHYNVTYMFDNGEYKAAKKMILVPFGEYIPLPKFAQKLINDTFFAGASDFKNASEPTDFLIKGVKFRNAICYEATCKEIYDGGVEFVIATSNNAWFAPSIEPTLQKLLIKHYARKNGTTVYHSANYRGSGIIK